MKEKYANQKMRSTREELASAWAGLFDSVKVSLPGDLSQSNRSHPQGSRSTSATKSETDVRPAPEGAQPQVVGIRTGSPTTHLFCGYVMAGLHDKRGAPLDLRAMVHMNTIARGDCYCEAHRTILCRDPTTLGIPAKLADLMVDFSEEPNIPDLKFVEIGNRWRNHSEI